MAWQLSGEYFETCSCDVLCPCITSQATARPTQGHCDAVLAFDIARGSSDGIDVSGLAAVIALQTDGPMAEGKGRREVYLDGRANDRQREALSAIFGGEAGGPPAALQGLVPDMLGVRSAKVDFRLDGNTRSVTIEGVGEQSVTGLPGLSGETLTLTNTGHPASSTLAVARAGATARFKDAAFDFNNAGKNGHFAPFNWQS